MKKAKEAVSLVVLVLTIVIMVILGGVIIMNLGDSGLMTEANNAIEETNLDEIKELASVGWATAYTDPDRQRNVADLTDGVLDYLESATGLSREELLEKYDIDVSVTGVDVTLK